MVLTTSLKDDIRDNAVDRLETDFTHSAVGNDSTTPTPADTALGSEDFRSAVDEFSKPGGGVAIASLRILTTENNGNSIAENAWLNAASAGTMWTRNTMTLITKTNAIQVYLDTRIETTVVET